MSLMTQIRLAAMAILAASLMAACGKSDDVDNAFGDADSILRYVPADAPYVLARLEPLPAEFRDRIRPHNEIVRQQNRAMFETLIENSVSEDEQSAADAEKTLSMIRRFMDLAYGEGLEDAGISADGQLVAFGHGLMPVLRFELSDPGAFREFVASMADETGVTLVPAKLGSSDYEFVDLGSVRVLFFIDGGQAVAALVESDAPDSGLAARLGLDLPAENIADAGTLAAIVGTYDFLDDNLGYIDFMRLFDELVTAAANYEGGTDRRTDAPMFDETCRADVRRLVGAMPRMVAGIRRADADGIASSTIIELREDIARDLSGLAAPVPGLGTIEADFATFGMSFDAKIARAFVDKRVKSIIDKPFECRFFARYNELAVQTSQFLERQPLPPTAYDFKGFVIAVDSIDGLGINPAAMTASMRALIAIDNAESLMALGNMFVPEIAALELKPNGEIARLSTERLGGTKIDAFVSMTKNAIGVATGAGSDEALEALMALKPNVDAPLLHANVDATAYLSLVRRSMSMNDSDPAVRDVQSNVETMLDSLSELYDRLSVDVLTSEHGIELRSEISLKPR